MQVVGTHMKRHKQVSFQVHIPHTTKSIMGYKLSYKAFELNTGTVLGEKGSLCAYHSQGWSDRKAWREASIPAKSQNLTS